jgi:Putative S-adenosyl-L-methionine-dependent methyltransferase
MNQGMSSWVMNVVPTSEPNSLPVIYDRGLIGVAHDWYAPRLSPTKALPPPPSPTISCSLHSDHNQYYYVTGVSHLIHIQGHMICFMHLAFSPRSRKGTITELSETVMEASHLLRMLNAN